MPQSLSSSVGSFRCSGPGAPAQPRRESHSALGFALGGVRGESVPSDAPCGHQRVAAGAGAGTARPVCRPARGLCSLGGARCFPEHWVVFTPRLSAVEKLL